MRAFFAYLLYPITILYSIGVYLRNLSYDLGWKKSIKHDITTIGVGNLRVGGTGKTPHVEHLIEAFSDIYKVGVLSRGYGRKTKGLRIIDLEKDNAQSVGDEPLQMKQKYPSIVFAVCEDRNKGIDAMVKQYKELELIILDDAFQHRSLSLDLSVLLTEYSKPFFNDKILPFGLLREQKKGYKRADYIIITKSPHNFTIGDKVSFESQIRPKKYQKIFFSNIDYKPLYSLFSNQIIEDFSTNSIILLTAIADNSQMLDYISQTSSVLQNIEYPDHYRFQDKDIEKILETYNSLKQDNTIIITTEKDATRLIEFERLRDLPIFVLPISLTISSTANKSTSFKEIIIDDVRQNKSYSRIY